MSRRNRPYPGAVHATVDRFGWPVVLAILFAALLVLLVALFEGRAAHRESRMLLRERATDSARHVGDYLNIQLGNHAQFISRNADAFQAGNQLELESRVRRTYLPLAATSVLGVIVTDTRGEAVIVAERQQGTLGSSEVIAELEATARAASTSGRPLVTGRLEAGLEEHAYALASPLGRVNERLGAWVVVYDAQESAIGTFITDNVSSFHRDPSVVDDRGKVLFGPPVPDREDVEGFVREPVRGADNWSVTVPILPARGAVPGWVLVLVAVGILLLGVVYWLQDNVRRGLQRESQERAAQVEHLYELAHALLYSDTPREQANHLAHAVLDAAELDGVRVRVARDRDRFGTVVGQLHPEAREYRVAITGPRGALGEVTASNRTGRVDDHQRNIARAMAGMAGAAMHTLTVLERERGAAIEMQRVDDLRTNLLSTVAHELRSPLTAVKGVLTLLAMQNDLSERQREYVDIAADRTDALVDLIRDLFDASLMESGQLDIRPRRCDAGELLDSALGALAAGRTSEIVLSATPNLKVTVDPLRFDQIANNLVTNALRHGRPPVVVELRPYRDGALLVVSDDGPGIPADERERIFKKFYQSSTGHARLVEGAGLGLALVQGLVQLHGGWIEVGSVRMDGRGARFTAFFPDVTPEQPGHGGAADEFGPLPPAEDGLSILRDII